MLYARRKRLEARAEAEAAGESFWTTQFDERARIKLVHAFNDACPEYVREGSWPRESPPTPSPMPPRRCRRRWRPFHRNHPDHRAAGEATMSAIFPDARNPFAHPELLDEEGLKPWEVGEVWLSEPKPGSLRRYH
jgi:hypothetical protein